MKYKIVIIIFLSIIMCIPTASAWSHGNPTGDTYANYMSEYVQQNYGTRDWFADQVIECIGNFDPMYSENWLNVYRLYYLLGTELVTSNNVNIENKLIINNTKITRYETDLNLYTRFSRTQLLSFDSETEMLYIYNSMVDAINIRKLDVASIYLGMFISLFCKATYFPSFMVNDHLNYVVYNNVSIEDNIQIDVYQKTQTDFFNSNATYHSNNISWIDAYKISANYTYFGTFSSRGLYDADFLFNNFTTACITTTDWNEIDSELSLQYYTKLKQNFNIASYQCASAIYTCFKSLNLEISEKMDDPNIMFVSYENKTLIWIILGVVGGLLVGLLLIIKYKDNRETYSYYYQEKKRLNKIKKERKNEYKMKVKDHQDSHKHGHRLG